ncbi:MAG: Sporulation inhibitor [Neobacillus sp.]|jgi:developmental checkpoint coupling sporulation initiation to replication initiation|nr:Sporulation inhibitor [Neobacillus sp.]
MLSRMSNKEVVDSYIRAVELKLDQDFICMLEKELSRRGINTEEVKG